ncbi:type II toxin-antitoxin system prevent-host-death family antitoxin [bacterium]|nr:type II toxin-antitoxin system prevent-host-death family antitoxin [bacterium]
MDSMGIYEAKTHFAELIDRASKGHRIMITKRGVPVATIIPPETKSRRSTSEVISELREIRKGCRLNGLSIRELIEEGRQ